MREAFVMYFKVLSQHWPGRTEDSNERYQVGPSMGQDLNPGSPE
jgi:hypothetical protein